MSVSFQLSVLKLRLLVGKLLGTLAGIRHGHRPAIVVQVSTESAKSLSTISDAAVVGVAVIVDVKASSNDPSKARLFYDVKLSYQLLGFYYVIIARIRIN